MRKLISKQLLALKRKHYFYYKKEYLIDWGEGQVEGECLNEVLKKWCALLWTLSNFIPGGGIQQSLIDYALLGLGKVRLNRDP